MPSTHPGLKKCFIADGLLCRKFQGANLSVHTQIILPSSLIPTVLQQLHDQAGHLGVQKTTDRVKERFYWPGYEQDIEKWIRDCELCQRRNPPHPSPRAPLETIRVQRPFQRVSWDLMGPLPTSENGNKFILTVTDLFTKWVEAFPLKETTSPTLAATLVDNVICRYGVPENLHSDQGPNLCSEVITKMCSLLGIERT